MQCIHTFLLGLAFMIMSACFDIFFLGGFASCLFYQMVAHFHLHWVAFQFGWKVIQIYSWIALEIWVGQFLSVLAWPLAYSMFGLKEPIRIDWFLIRSYIKRKIKLYDFQAFNFVVWESLKGILDIFKPKMVIWYLSHSTLFCKNC